MAISTELRYAGLDDLHLDPLNPRLGRNNTGQDVLQETVLGLMRDWTLDEIALSYLESGGFWTHEALLVVEDDIYGGRHLIVVEGNRRLAALKYLREAVEGRPVSKKWAEIAQSGAVPDGLFSRVPYLLAASRSDVQAFLGFRHVTGIKEWRLAEKAEFSRGTARRTRVPSWQCGGPLHARGLRYRVNYAITIQGVRIRPDVVFTRRKVAVFVDGCFWHGCPVHGTQPRQLWLLAAEAAAEQGA